MGAEDRQAKIEMAVELSRIVMTTSHAAELFSRASADIQQGQARARLMKQVREEVEALEAAAEAARAAGDAALSRNLGERRDRLKEAALDPRLGL